MKTEILKAQTITAEAFKPFGQVVTASDDMKPYGPGDIELDLTQGIPRFYMIRVKGGSLTFDQITHHAKVTQCLAPASMHHWYMAVASPDVQPAPKKEDIKVFRIPPGEILKLHRGTWHAGPLFDGEASLDFYNLELSDTNQVDHNNHYFRDHGIEFRIKDEAL